MKTFLREVAERLYADYGESVSSLYLLFPNRRSRLFFNEALAAVAGKPLWQPHYLSPEELSEKIVGMHASDNIRLIAELYKIYSRYHSESFDNFYFWGEVLLSDFDAVDREMIDARTLFVNIADLKTIESDLAYLTEDQAQIVSQFWRNFNPYGTASREKQDFMHIWNSLLDIYREYRQRLSELGMAYPGMIARAAAEKLRAYEKRTYPLTDKEEGEKEEPASDFTALEELMTQPYMVIGFNALSKSERVLMDFLSRQGAARFFWDYDTYYTENPAQEAGDFVRENLKRFPEKELFADRSHFVKPKEIVTVAAPSDAMQCKYVTRFLNELLAEGKTPDKETVVVLPDENLLLPVLHAVPKEIPEINITMGYPLRQTPAYTFVERLIELQKHKKEKGTVLFYHSDVRGLLSHPYIQYAAEETASALSEAILAKQQIYIPARTLTGHPVLENVFRPVTGWENLCEYLIGALTAVGEIRLADIAEDDMHTEFFTLIIEHLYKLENSLRNCGIELADAVLFSLVRKTLQAVRVPYEGEPLGGVQIMGMLETRNLDFENVLILSVNDDILPGNRGNAGSFIPFHLRMAYGLPTPQQQEGIYSYYFYRILQRAKRVHLVYSAKTDDRKTGECSRYIYQLDYESPHPVKHKSMVLNVSFARRLPLEIEKSGEIRSELEAYLGQGADRRLSPSTFYGYVECPVKFYFRNIARLKEEEEITEEVDLPMFGNILHKAAEIIYGNLIGKPNPGPALDALIRSGEIDPVVNAAVSREYFREEQGMAEEDFGGNIRLVADIVRKYLATCLLKYDAAHGDFTVAGVGKWVNAVIDIETGGKRLPVHFGGKIDRLDRLNDGCLRVVDYKTGSRRQEFRGIPGLFADRHAYRNPAALQTLLYALMLNLTTGKEVVPALYYVRYMNAVDYIPNLVEAAEQDKGRGFSRLPVQTFGPYKRLLLENLGKAMGELFDKTIPFRQCSDPKTCALCAYRELCDR